MNMNLYQIVQLLTQNQPDAEITLHVEGKPDEKYIIDTVEQSGYSGSKVSIKLIKE